MSTYFLSFVVVIILSSKQHEAAHRTDSSSCSSHPSLLPAPPLFSPWIHASFWEFRFLWTLNSSIYWLSAATCYDGSMITLIDLGFSFMVENHLLTWSPPRPTELLWVLTEWGGDGVHYFSHLSCSPVWNHYLVWFSWTKADRPQTRRKLNLGNDLRSSNVSNIPETFSCMNVKWRNLCMFKLSCPVAPPPWCIFLLSPAYKPAFSIVQTSGVLCLHLNICMFCTSFCVVCVMSLLGK